MGTFVIDTSIKVNCFINRNVINNYVYHNLKNKNMRFQREILTKSGMNNYIITDIKMS